MLRDLQVLFIYFIKKEALLAPPLVSPRSLRPFEQEIHALEGTVSELKALCRQVCVFCINYVRLIDSTLAFFCPSSRRKYELMHHKRTRQISCFRRKVYLRGKRHWSLSSSAHLPSYSSTSYRRLRQMHLTKVPQQAMVRTNVPIDAFVSHTSHIYAIKHAQKRAPALRASLSLPLTFRSLLFCVVTPRIYPSELCSTRLGARPSAWLGAFGPCICPAFSRP